MSDRGDCRAVLLTPPGRGAISTVQVDGPRATKLVGRLFTPAKLASIGLAPIGRIVFGQWKTRGDAAEDVVVARRSDEVLEVHCHGGLVAAQAIIHSLVEAGCRQTDWAQWARTQDTDPIRAEARIALASALTERTAQILLDQYQGALSASIEQILGDIKSGECDRAACRLKELLAWSDVGIHLTEPWRVVVAGPTNAGKSSLVNALLGYQRSIVYDQPGTTRDVVNVLTAMEGWPVELADTAGIRDTSDWVESTGQARARRRLETADVVVLVFDASIPWSEADHDLLAVWPHALLVHNKCDLPPAESPSRPPGMMTSTVTRDGIEAFIAQLAAKLVKSAPLPSTAIPFTRRQIDAIREAIQTVGTGDRTTAAGQLAQLVLNQ